MNKRSFGYILKKRILPLLLLVIVLLQFIPRAATNDGLVEGPNFMGNKYTIPADINQLLKASCYDCHSNHTEYPWYAKIQPVYWWLNDHIIDGKKHMNFSEFNSYSLAKQFHKLEEVESEVESGEMPLESYTYIHRDEKLDEDQKTKIIEWSKSVRAYMTATYPADSLVRKKRTGPTPVTK